MQICFHVGAVYDLNLSTEVINSMSNIPHFTRIHEALKTAIETKQKLNIKDQQERARRQLDIRKAEKANRSLSHFEPAEGYICPICLFALRSQDELIGHWQQMHSSSNNTNNFENECFEDVSMPEGDNEVDTGNIVVTKNDDDEMAVIDIENVITKRRSVSECEDVVNSFVNVDDNLRDQQQDQQQHLIEVTSHPDDTNDNPASPVSSNEI